MSPIDLELIEAQVNSGHPPLIWDQPGRLFEILGEENATVGFVLFDRQRNGSFEVIVWIYDRYQRGGIASEALREAIAIVRQEEPMAPVFAIILATNPQKRRVARLFESLGFYLETWRYRPDDLALEGAQHVVVMNQRRDLHYRLRESREQAMLIAS